MKTFYKAAEIKIFEEKTPCEKGFKRISVEYEGIKYYVCYAPVTEDIPSKISRTASREANDWVVLALYGYFTQRAPSFYYVNQKKGYMVSFSVTDRGDEGVEVVAYYVPGPVSEEEIYDLNEEIHQGLGAIEIAKTPKEIRSEYVKDDTAKILLLVGILAVAIGYGSYALLFEEEKETVVHRKPTVKPLTVYEKNELRRNVSKKMIADMAAEVLKIETTPLIENRRIERIDFKMAELKPQKPYKTKSGEWKFKTKWKRGGFYASVTKMYAQDFPGVGFKKKGEGVFVKKKTESRRWTELDLNLSRLKNPSYLTKECLMAPLYYQDAKPEILSRSETGMEIGLKDAYPSGFLKDFYEYFDKCPAYIKKINLNPSRGTINAVITLYVPEKTPGFSVYVRKPPPKGRGSVSIKKRPKNKGE